MTKPTDSGETPLNTATRLVHSGHDPADYHGFVNPPVVHASTILYPNVQATVDRTQKYTYGRKGTPTTEALCEVVSGLEGAERTVLTGSGLTACALALFAVTGAGERIIVVDNIYNPTRQFCDGQLARFGVATTYVDCGSEEALQAALDEGPVSAVFLEAPGSASFEMIDIPARAAQAKAAGATVLMDNTWATPLFFRPLDHGVDLSIQAATKYFAGHSDLLMGTIAGNGEAIAKVHKAAQHWGMNVGPDDVFMTLRGIRTLDVRLERHQRNARIVAEWLSAHPAVHRVLYPALPGAPGHEIWKRTMTGASGLFAITFKGDVRRGVEAFVDNLSLFGIGYSWGGFESLAVVQPVPNMRSCTEWPADEHVVRLHSGLEDPADLIADLSANLDAAFSGDRMAAE